MTLPRILTDLLALYGLADRRTFRSGRRKPLRIGLPGPSR
jgi:hypothetical protein